jgi:hypothetical protein
VAAVSLSKKSVRRKTSMFMTTVQRDIEEAQIEHSHSNGHGHGHSNGYGHGHSHVMEHRVQMFRNLSFFSMPIKYTVTMTATVTVTVTVTVIMTVTMTVTLAQR